MPRVPPALSGLLRGLTAHTGVRAGTESGGRACLAGDGMRTVATAAQGLEGAPSSSQGAGLDTSSGVAIAAQPPPPPPPSPAPYRVRTPGGQAREELVLGFAERLLWEHRPVADTGADASSSSSSSGSESDSESGGAAQFATTTSSSSGEDNGEEEEDGQGWGEGWRRGEAPPQLEAAGVERQLRRTARAAKRPGPKMRVQESAAEWLARNPGPAAAFASLMASHGVDPDPVLQTLDAQPGRLAAALSRPALAEHVAAWMDALRALSLPITTGQLLAACPQLLAAPDSALAELPQRLGELERALGGRNALRDALLAAPELLLLSGAGGDAARRLQTLAMSFGKHAPLSALLRAHPRLLTASDNLLHSNMRTMGTLLPPGSLSALLVKYPQLLTAQPTLERRLAGLEGTLRVLLAQHQHQHGGPMRGGGAAAAAGAGEQGARRRGKRRAGAGAATPSPPLLSAATAAALAAEQPTVLLLGPGRVRDRWRMLESGAALLTEWREEREALLARVAAAAPAAPPHAHTPYGDAFPVAVPLQQQFSKEDRAAFRTLMRLLDARPAQLLRLRFASQSPHTARQEALLDAVLMSRVQFDARYPGWEEWREARRGRGGGGEQVEEARGAPAEQLEQQQWLEEGEERVGAAPATAAAAAAS